MNLKITIIVGLLLASLIGVQTYRLSSAQEEIGGLQTAVQVLQAQQEARDASDQLVLDVKTAIYEERQQANRQLAITNRKIEKALANVQTNPCFDDNTAIPVEYVRVLNGGDGSASDSED